MPYEPSKELIEQIAKESCNAMRENGLLPAGWEVLTKDGQEEFTQAQVLPYAINLPTILKALELYENQPQWRDKPDKTGWWWECHEAGNGSFRVTFLSPVAVNRHNENNINVCTDFEFKRWVPIEDYISKAACRVKFMYLHRPELYKGEE